jgi:hypothetical protein
MDARAFKPTHIIHNEGSSTPVLVDEGRAYTRDEWDAYEAADWELVDGQLLFQGSAIHGGTIVPVGASQRRVTTPL